MSKKLFNDENKEMLDEEIDDTVLKKLKIDKSDIVGERADDKENDIFERVDRGGYSFSQESSKENGERADVNIEEDVYKGHISKKDIDEDVDEEVVERIGEGVHNLSTKKNSVKSKKKFVKTVNNNRDEEEKLESDSDLEDSDITIDETSRKRLLDKDKRGDKDNKKKFDKGLMGSYSARFNREITEFFGKKSYEEVNKKIGNVDSKAFDINLSSDSSENKSGIKKFSQIQFEVNDFELKGKDKISAIDDTYINRSYWKDIFYHFVKNKGAVVGFACIIIITLMALIGPIASRYSYNSQTIEHQNLPPRIPLIEKLGIFDGYEEINTSTGTERINRYLGIEVTQEETKSKSKSAVTIGNNSEIELESGNLEDEENEEIQNPTTENKNLADEGIQDIQGDANDKISLNQSGSTEEETVKTQSDLKNVYYWFGTDVLGRDIFTRTWMGTRISLYIAFIAVLVDMVFGLGYGLISGYFGGVVDNIMQRIPEILSGIPDLVIVSLLILIFKPGLVSITVAIMITGWISMNRIARAQMLKLKEQEFVLATRTLGANNFMIIFKEVLPNIFGQVITNTMFSIPNAIFTEAFLAFIGLGVPAPMASLGSLISDGFKSFTTHPYMIVPPVVVLAILMLSFNLLADGLRDAFDPKMKER